MIFIKGYYYVYWRCYDLISLTGNYDLAWGASHFMSFTLCLLLINMYSAFNIYNIFSIQQTSAIFLFTFLFLELFNYIIFVKHEKYMEIVASHKEENSNLKLVGRVLLSAALVNLIYRLF